MEARSQILNAAVFLLIVAGASQTVVLAGPLFTYGGNFDLPIPANPGDTEGPMEDAVIIIPDHHIIHDLDVAVSITHTKVFDLQIFLESPAGTNLCLNMYNFDEYFEGEDNTQTIFDDEAQLSIEDAIAPFTGRFKPMAGSFLGVFDGEDAFGQWRLQIYDMWAVDTGTLENLEITIAAPEPATILFLTLGTGLIGLFRPR